MPAGTDCVAPFDAVKVDGDRAEALVPCQSRRRRLAGRAAIATAICRCAAPASGCALTDLAAFAAAGIAAHQRARAAHSRACRCAADAIVTAAARLIAGDIETPRRRAAHGQRARSRRRVGDGQCRRDCRHRRHRQRPQRHQRADAGARRPAWRCTASRLTPGETAAFGFAGSRPVLLLPGRLDAALAVWLTLGRRLLARLAGGDASERAGRDADAGAQGRRRPSASPNSCRCAAAATRPSRWPRNICRCRRWRAPTAGSWCRPTAKAIPPAAEVAVRPWP